MARRIISLLLAYLVCAALAGCDGDVTTTSSGTDSDGTSSSPTEIEKEELTYYYCETINNDSVVIPVSAPDQSLYYYDSLKNGQEDLTWIYNEIVYAATHLSNPNSEFKNVSEVHFREDITEEQLRFAYESVYFDHPELWYLRQPDKLGCELHPDSNTMAYLTYSDNIEDIPEINSQIESVADSIIRGTEDFTSSVDIMAHICAYLYDNCRVNWDAYNGEDNSHSSLKEMLLNGRGVCVGFASTVTYLSQRAGIATFSGHGNVASGMAHCWTIYNFEGMCTYSDVYYMREKGGGTEYGLGDFFCCTDIKIFDEMQVTIAAGVPLLGTAFDSGIVAEGGTISDTSSSE